MSHASSARHALPDHVFAFREQEGLNAAWRDVLPLGTRSQLARGTSLPLGTSLYFLDQGKVRLSFISKDGLEKVVMYIASGSIFGEAPFFSGLPVVNSFFACRQKSLVYSFTRPVVERICAERPDLAMNLMQAMGRKLRLLFEQASSISLHSLRRRTFRFFQQRIEPGSMPPTARIGISKQEMASLLGVHRISLYKLLRECEEEGILAPLKGDRFAILDMQAFLAELG